METVETLLVPAETQEAVSKATELAKSYESFAVVSQADYSDAGEDLKVVKLRMKELDELRKSLTAPLDESKKRIMDFFRKPLDFLNRAKAAIDTAMVKWHCEQEAIRQAEERRLVEIQRKETKRLENEARLAEEKASKLKTEKAKQAAEEKAKELREKAAVVSAIAPTVESKVEAVPGVSTRKTWKCKIVDADKIPREYMMPDEKLLNSIATATKGSKKIEGVEFYYEETMVTRQR